MSELFFVAPLALRDGLRHKEVVWRQPVRHDSASLARCARYGISAQVVP